MNQKAEKPTLSGQRIKTRKRDEKEKYDPSAFRDSILQGFNEAGVDLEQVSNFLDKSGSRLDYRRYAETLFDILFAGGILAPGGSIVEDADPTKVSRTDICVFSSSEDVEGLKEYYTIFNKLIRRYKYLEKSFFEEIKKLIVFLKWFGPGERHKLGMITGLFLANGLGTPNLLLPMFEDHLIKDGIALDFATVVFKTWLKEKEFAHMNGAIKRSQLDNKLWNLFPVNKRTWENFEKHFSAAGLNQIVDYQKSQKNTEVKKELQKSLEELIQNEEPIKEIAAFMKEQMKKNDMSEVETTILTWNTLMNSIEWNKKEDLVAEQALRHLKQYAPLLALLCTSGRCEVSLLVKMQEYCYDNMNFMKVFQKIVVLFYKMDVLSEDAVLKWYNEAHSPKGKSIFLSQMKKFVEWLKSAEEESDESGEEN